MADKKPSRLGTGLSALFGEERNLLESEETTALPIAKLEPRKDQPRREFDPETLEALAESIREYGLLQPITVRALDRGFYQIIAGERRWRAARQAGLREVPVRIVEADDRLATEQALVENLQREDLNPMEEANGYRKLMEEYGLTQEQAARRVQKSRPAVANALRLLSLCPAVQSLVSDGSLSAGHARALASGRPRGDREGPFRPPDREAGGLAAQGRKGAAGEGPGVRRLCPGGRAETVRRSGAGGPADRREQREDLP